MESLLWALDLLALVVLCFWAIRKDKQDLSSSMDE